jgi:hypothetical protein
LPSIALLTLNEPPPMRTQVPLHQPLIWFIMQSAWLFYQGTIPRSDCFQPGGASPPCAFIDFRWRDEESSRRDVEKWHAPQPLIHGSWSQGLDKQRDNPTLTSHYCCFCREYLKDSSSVGFSTNRWQDDKRFVNYKGKDHVSQKVILSFTVTQTRNSKLRSETRTPTNCTVWNPVDGLRSLCLHWINTLFLWLCRD